MLGCAKGKAMVDIKGVWVHATQSRGFAMGAYAEDKQNSCVFVTGDTCSR